MRTLRPILAALYLALAIHITACQKKTSETSSTSYSEKSTETSGIKVTNVDLGRNVGGDKHVTDATTSFSPNDVIYASVLTSGTSPSATVKVRWTYEGDGQVVDESEQTITTTGDTATEFHISKPNGWPAGNYKAEVYLNGQLVQTKEFEVKT